MVDDHTRATLRRIQNLQIALLHRQIDFDRQIQAWEWEYAELIAQAGRRVERMIQEARDDEETTR